MTGIEQLKESGFTVLKDIFTAAEVETILSSIVSADTSKSTFRKSSDLFAIRQFLKEVPAIKEKIFNQKLKTIIQELIGFDYFIVKSIYFDKPERSNWFVSYHQDLTISVNAKADVAGYNSWTVKQNQFAVQPPEDILNSIYTIRIHLDDTDENNGALKVIPGSHLNGIHYSETFNFSKESETVCCVQKGGVMLMRPLLLHSSGRTLNNKRRRVIHIELSNADLDPRLSWAEKDFF